MSKGSVALFLFSILLVVCLSACHIVKRKAPDGQLYVFSSREGCVSVRSEAPCTLTWQLNPYVAKVYKQQNQVVNATIELYRSIPGVDNDCIQAVKNAQCSQAVPKCSIADYSLDYGDVSKLCQDVYNSCPPSIVNSLKQSNFCEKLKKGKHPHSSCVAPSSPVTGACPQPKYKMTPEYLAGYRETSASVAKNLNRLGDIKYANGERVFSSKCITLLKEISCTPVYCSADETKLLTKLERDDCNKAIKECFDDVLSKASSISGLGSSAKALRSTYQSLCDTYPKASAQLHEVPPTVPSSAASCQIGHRFLVAAMISYCVFKFLF